MSEPSRHVKVWLLLGVVLVCLPIGEALARISTVPERPVTTPHPYLRHVWNPDLEIPLASPLDGRRYSLRTDDQGFRTHRDATPESRAPESGEKGHRVFFVGGSTTLNRVLPAEDTFPFRIEEALLREGRSVRAFNTAHDGNQIADSFSLIAHRLLALDPSLIVVMHAINDLRASLTSRFDPTHYETRREPRPPRLGDVLRRYSQLYQLIQRADERLETRTGLDGERYRERVRAAPYTAEVDPTHGLPYFRRYLGMMASVSAEAGVPLVLMTQPSLYKPRLSLEEERSLWMGWLDHGELNLDPKTLLRGMEAYNQETRRFARERGLLLIDLADALPRDLEHFYDDCHLTVQGNRVVAEAILAELPRTLLP